MIHIYQGAMVLIPKCAPCSYGLAPALNDIMAELLLLLIIVKMESIQAVPGFQNFFLLY